MSQNESPLDQWNAAVDAQVARGLTKAQAVSAVVKANPKLHREYLAFYNSAVASKAAYIDQQRRKGVASSVAEARFREKYPSLAGAFR
jgi:hypothetical protein